jgi:predicted regulator of Ras-like GTPase activity (Roadblock/LC7/MglB family)
MKKICSSCKNVVVLLPEGKNPSRNYCSKWKKYVHGDDTCNDFEELPRSTSRFSDIDLFSVEQWDYVLKTLMNEVEGIESAAIVSKEGLIVHSIIDENVSSIHIAAMSAIILSVSERVLLEFKKGELDVCIIQGTKGKYVCMGLGEDYVLVCILSEDARIDIMFNNLKDWRNPPGASPAATSF